MLSVKISVRGFNSRLDAAKRKSLNWRSVRRKYLASIIKQEGIEKWRPQNSA